MQITRNILFVCQSVSWLTYILKLGQYRDILLYMRYLKEFFERHSWEVYTLLPNNKIFLYVCQSISSHTYMLKLGQYRDISCSRWYNIQNFFLDIPHIFLHYFQINTNCLYVCQSVRWLTSLLKLDKCRGIPCSEWDISLKFFWDIPRMFLDH